MPLAIALPASCRSRREFCVSNEASTTVTPALDSRAAFSSVAPSDSNVGMLVSGLMTTGTFAAASCAGDHPAFRRADQDEPHLELVGEPHRREQIARAVGLDGERHLPLQHRLQRLEVEAAARVVAALRGVERDPVDGVVLRVLQDLAQAQDGGRSRSAGHAGARLRRAARPSRPARA